MENTSEGCAVQANYESEDTPNRFVDVSHGLAKNTGIFLGKSYKILTQLSKAAKHSCEKIVGAPTVSDEEDLYSQLADPAADVADARMEPVFKTSSALDPGLEETSCSKRAMRALVTALESDLAVVRNQLQETQNRVDQLRSGLKALDAEKQSLVCELEGLQGHTNDQTAEEDVVSGRVALLESDLAVARGELEKARGQDAEAQEQLTSRLKAIQAKNESLICDLAKAGDEVNDTRVQAKQASGRASMLDSDLSADQYRLSESVQEEVAETIENSVEPLIEKAAEADEQTRASSDSQESGDLPARAQLPGSPEVTKEEIEAADFSSPADKIILSSTLPNLVDNQDEGIRVYAAKTISGIRHQLSVRVLIAQLAREPSVKVRQECIKALGAVGMKEGQDAVEHALGNEIVEIRLAAVRALYNLAGIEAAPALLAMFSDEDELVRRRAATYIGWLGEDEYAVELLALLNDSSVMVRRAAVESMANLRCREVVSGLIDHLNDPDKTVGKAIADTLTIITGEKMSLPFPENHASLQRLITRWRQLWQEQCQDKSHVRVRSKS